MRVKGSPPTNYVECLVVAPTGCIQAFIPRKLKEKFVGIIKEGKRMRINKEQPYKTSKENASRTRFAQLLKRSPSIYVLFRRAQKRDARFCSLNIKQTRFSSSKYSPASIKRKAREESVKERSSQSNNLPPLPYGSTGAQ